MVKMKSGKRKRNSKNSTTPESQIEEPKAVAPVVGAGKNGTLAACIKRPRIEGKDSATRSIPTEIIFNILLLVPASILRDIMRFVCKEWNAIISDPLFIRAHLCRSLSSSSSHRLGFLVQDQCLRDTMSKQAFYIHTNGNGNGNDATGTGYSCTKIKLPYKAIIMGSCNGLVLLLNSRTRKARKDMFVVNLVTRAKTMLPSLSRSRVRIMYIPYTTLAFAPSSGQYKVVYVSFASKNKKPAYVKNYCVEQLWTELEVKVMVCTIGVDQTWRAIDCKGITMSDEVKRTLMSQPFSNSSAGGHGHGHIYWFHKHYTCGLALDVDAETMYQFAGPKDYLMTYSSPMSLRMDTDLGVGLGMVHVRVPARLWKVWELIEPKTGTWSQATDIDVACMNSALRSHFNPCRFDFSAPLLLSLKRGEFWVLCVVGAKYRLACYNWKTGNIWSPSIIWPDCLDTPHLHINSLLSLKNL